VGVIRVDDWRSCLCTGSKGSLQNREYRFFRIGEPIKDARRLSRAVTELTDRIRPCGECGNFSEAELCDVCASPRRDRGVLCVVEEAYEVAAIERTGQYGGLFHVLGGRLSPLDGIGPEQLNLTSLLERVRIAEVPIREVIIATNASVEGEATAHYLSEMARRHNVVASRIAHGVPMGGELEYVDSNTLSLALQGRKIL